MFTNHRGGAGTGARVCVWLLEGCIISYTINWIQFERFEERERVRDTHHAQWLQRWSCRCRRGRGGRPPFQLIWMHLAAWRRSQPQPTTMSVVRGVWWCVDNLHNFCALLTGWPEWEGRRSGRVIFLLFSSDLIKNILTVFLVAFAWVLVTTDTGPFSAFDVAPVAVRGGKRLILI